MHRRQYLPGSQHKLNRTQLAERNRKLTQIAESARATAHEERERRKDAESQTFRAKVSAFVGGVKRALTRPVTFNRRTT